MKMARSGRSICDLRLREVTPYLSCAILTMTIIGYLGGYIIVDLSSRNRQVAQADLLARQELAHQELHQPRITVTLHKESDVLVAASDNGDDDHVPIRHQRMPRYRNGGNKPTATAGDEPVDAPMKCKIRRNDGQWLDWSSDSFLLYVYSAIFDDRSSLLLDSSKSGLIRIIGVSSTLAEKANGTGNRLPNDLSCHLYYEDGSSLIARLGQSPKPIGYGWFVDSKPVREYIFTCPCPIGRIPTSVNLRRSTAQQTEFFCLPVEIPSKPATNQHLAICAEIIHESPEPYRAIEWLEMQRLLGVSSVFLYTMNELDKASKGYQVLSYYSTTGADEFVKLRVTSQFGSRIDSGQHAVHNSPIINDCIYRNMYRYRYIMVVDMTEIIIPQKPSATLVQMIEYLEQLYSMRKPSNYVFWNTYHFTDWPPDIEVSPYTTLLRYRRQAALSDYGHNIKSIIDPQTCVNMHTQYCWSVTRQAAKTGQSYMEVINPTIAVKQTYRKCHYERVHCENLRANSTMDNTVMAFRFELLQIMSTRVSNIIGHDI